MDIDKALRWFQGALAAAFVAIVGLFLAHVPVPAFGTVAVILASFLTLVVRGFRRGKRPTAKVLWWILPVALVLLVGSTPIAQADSCGYVPVATFWCWAPPSWFQPMAMLWSCWIVWISVYTCSSTPYAIRPAL